MKALEGEKTDAIDSERIGTLLRNHELRGSFVPPREIREYSDQLNKPKVVRRLVERLNRLGYPTELIELGAAAPTDGSKTAEAFLTQVMEVKGNPPG